MKYQDIVTNVNRIIAGYSMRLTLRQIYYRLVAGGFIPNNRSNYNQLSSQLVAARERGDVDDDRIVDRSRSVADMSFDGAEDFLTACQATLETHYLRRFWDSQPFYVEVWVEKDALSQVIANAVDGFNTVVAPSRGYSSYSYLMEAASRIKAASQDKQPVILHFADHDPSGLDMSRDLQDRLNRYYKSAPSITVVRIALTFNQVNSFNLTPNPVKAADGRSPAYVEKYGDKCWELDAIEPSQLVQICQGAVAKCIVNLAEWESLKAQDEKERSALTSQLDELLKA